MYQTADSVSSNDGNKQHSERKVDALLLNNGYSSRVLQQIKLKKSNEGRENEGRAKCTIASQHSKYHFFLTSAQHESKERRSH